MQSLVSLGRLGSLHGSPAAQVYRSVLKTTKPTKKTITVRTEDSVEALRNCFEITDWSIFDDS